MSLRPSCHGDIPGARAHLGLPSSAVLRTSTPRFAAFGTSPPTDNVGGRSDYFDLLGAFSGRGACIARCRLALDGWAARQRAVDLCFRSFPSPLCRRFRRVCARARSSDVSRRGTFGAIGRGCAVRPTSGGVAVAPPCVSIISVHAAATGNFPLGLLPSLSGPRVPVPRRTVGVSHAVRRGSVVGAQACAGAVVGSGFLSLVRITAGPERGGLR